MDPLTAALDPCTPLEAEQSVLSAMLRDNACIPELSLLLSADDFASDAHQKVFAAVASRGGLPTDLVLLHGELVRLGRLADCGGAAYLAELWDAAPSAANAGHYAAAVRDASLRRSLARVAREILRDCAAPSGPAAESVAAAERALSALSGRCHAGRVSTLGEAADAVLAGIEAVEAGRASGAPEARLLTGVAGLDALLGGLRPANLVVLAARPSVGKSAVAGIIATHMAKAGRAVLFASLEMSKEELAVRALSAESGVEGRRVHAADLDQTAAGLLTDAAGVLRPLDFHLDDAPTQSLAHLASVCRGLRRRGRLDCVFVDYLQLVDPADRRANRNEQVGAVSRGLKALARELACPVVALAQLNRQSEGRSDPRPRLSDLRDSGEIEQDSDVVVFLYQDPGAPDALELIVAKVRNGERGTAVVRFDRARMRLGGDAGRGNEPEVF